MMLMRRMRASPVLVSPNKHDSKQLAEEIEALNGKKNMNSRERVLATLNHQQPDRVPVDFGGTPVTGIHVSVIDGLRKELKLDPHPVRVSEPYQMLGEVEDDLVAALGIDTVQISAHKSIFGYPLEDYKPWVTPWGQTVMVPGKFNYVVDKEGDILVFPEGDTSVPPSGKMPKSSFFFDTIIRQPELPEDDDDLNPEDNLEDFGLLDAEALDYFQRSCAEGRKGGRAVLANIGGTAIGDIAMVPGPFLKHPKGIRDIQEWYISTATRQDYLHQIFDRQTEIALLNLQAVKNVAGDNIDVAFLCGNDFGTQSSQFCSRDTFSELYMPYYKRITGWIHQNTNWKCFKHSCGAIFGLIDLMIDAGFDILNPVQISATGMDPMALKNRYGKDITFWGGGVDTQKVLPFGTPAEVRTQVLQLLEIFSKDGGYVFNTVHNTQAGVPVKNFMAMIDAVHEFNGVRR